MKLLVITPTLGKTAFLRGTIESVIALGVSLRHVIVCPTAATEKLRRDHPQLEIVADDNPGVYAAINRGLAVGGEWNAWTWLNDDDFWCVEGMRRSLERMGNDSRVDVVYGRVDYVDRNGRSLGPLPVEANPERLRELFTAGVPALTQHGTIARRTLAERLGRLDLEFRLAADFDYWARAIAAGARCAHMPTVVAYYRLHQGQLSSDTATVRREIEASAARNFGGVAPATKRRVAQRFRRRHLFGLIRRFVRSGCWRSEELFRRAALEDGGSRA